MTDSAEPRFAALLRALERIAGGDLDHRIVLSERHDELDAVAHAVNVLVGELQIVAEGLRRAKEEAEAANVAKTTFLRNVSHELRTPLSVILIMSDLLGSQTLPESRTKDLHARIASSGRALVGILDDLLDLSKIEADKLVFDLEPLSLGCVSSEVVATFEADATQRGLGLLLERDEGEDVHVLADAKRVRQILTNLIGNALKFTAKGRVTVRVATGADPSRAVVDVADTGIGLTAEQRAAIFEPFVQADRSIERRFGGSGLGLALSKRFAEGMNGALTVLDSSPGRGATFRLTLPTTEVGARRSSPTRATGHEPSHAAFADQRLLVVEDNPEVRTATAHLLRLHGARVTEAPDGEAALELYREGAFDAVLMDVRMAGIDGPETTRRLRARGAAVPILALTADAVPEQMEACRSAGCTAFLRKPLDLTELAAHLQRPGGSASEPPSVT